MTAHHALDQWETFFMRLSRGSALKGLASIRPISRFHNVALVRPLLTFSPVDIRETLRVEFGITEYVRDPSNEQLEFERVRWRKAYVELAEKRGLDLANVCQTTERLQAADNCLDELAEQLLQDMFNGEYIDNEKFRTLHIELRMRMLNKLIDRLAHNAPRIVSYDLLKRTAEAMYSQNFKATNIAGLVFRRRKNNRINVALEER
jgi:tRNA(Ile)-lysidine synthase